jgi:GAF domain-containing protein
LGAAAGGGADHLVTPRSRAVDALLVISRAVAEGTDLRATLDTIAREAVGVVGAESASVLLLDRPSTLRLGGAHGLSREYESFLRSRFIADGHGLAGIALQEGRTVVTEDVEASTSPAAARPWRLVARREGYRSMVSTPLRAEREVLGVLNVYRLRSGPWSDEEIELLAGFGDHAASAIGIAQLLESRARDVDALSRIIQALRDQAHEYANRIHVLADLLSLGDYDAAGAFLAEFAGDPDARNEPGMERIAHVTVAAAVLAELSGAARRGCRLELDVPLPFAELPERFSAADAVTVIANLVENALDAVESLEPERRTVALRLASDEGGIAIVVSDRGVGLPPGDVFARGRTTKAGHAGVGLGLVAEAVGAAGGELRAERHTQGTSVHVHVPWTHTR